MSQGTTARAAPSGEVNPKMLDCETLKIKITAVKHSFQEKELIVELYGRGSWGNVKNSI
mgnify:FL=1